MRRSVKAALLWKFMLREQMQNLQVLFKEDISLYLLNIFATASLKSKKISNIIF